MEDTYRSFGQLAAHERRGTDFRVRSRLRKRAVAIVAPHGGSIEPGTSEIAKAIAGIEFSFYAFEGLKARNNGRLHLTSSRFDEPTCLAMLAFADQVITVHGEGTKRRVVFLGGRDKVCLDRIRKALRRRGFCVERHQSVRLQGVSNLNICNRGKSRAGVQIELSQGLRRAFFHSLSREGRFRPPKKGFREFVAAIREVMLGWDASDGAPALNPRSFA